MSENLKPKTFKVLWVDDEAFILKAIQRFFRNTEFSIVAVSHPEKALELTASESFDIIVSDQKMPALSGLEFLKKTMQTCPNAVRVMVSAFLNDNLVNEVKSKCHVKGFLNKPWSDTELLVLFEKLKDQLGGREIESERISLDENIDGVMNFVKNLTQVEGYADLQRALSAFLFESLNDGDFIFINLNKQWILSESNLAQFKKPMKENLIKLEMRKHLADQLGRPISKIINWKWEGFLLICEHGLSHIKEQELIAKFSASEGFIKSCIDKLIAREVAVKVTKHWEGAFDDLGDPIAIVDHQFNLIRSNQIFIKGFGRKCYQVFKGSNSICKNCPLTNLVDGTVSRDQEVYLVKHYEIKSMEVGSQNHLVHYRNQTQINKGRKESFQNKRAQSIGRVAESLTESLNEPLDNILYGSQKLIKSKDSPAWLVDDLRQVEGATRRCQKIIQNLMTFAKGDKEKGVEVVSINDVIDDTLPLLKNILSQYKSSKKLTQEFNVVRIHKGLFQQVLFNLIYNACQALNDDGYIKIKTEYKNKRVVLTVEDNGMGIEPENFNKIFDPFYSTKPEGKGTGLGLSMCKTIVESFNGHLTFESEKGKGSIFKIELPFAGRSL